MNTTMRSTRTWTDEQLREAVSSQVSWRAVARRLDLKDTSAGVIRTIKRHARRLALDTSHFTGQRRWSDRQLKSAVANGACWADVLAALETSDCAESRVRIKGHAIRLGLNVDHLRKLSPDSEPIGVTPASRTKLRVAAPSIAMAWFALRGYPVSLPIEPQEYDLLVTMPKGIQRVQVKSTTSRSPTGRWSVGVGRRPYSLDKTAGKAPYDPDSIDQFFIIDGDGALYLIPSRVLAGRTSVYIDGYVLYKVGDASSLLA